MDPVQAETMILPYLACFENDKLLINSRSVTLTLKEIATFYSGYVFTVVRGVEGHLRKGRDRVKR